MALLREERECPPFCGDGQPQGLVTSQQTWHQWPPTQTQSSGAGPYRALHRIQQIPTELWMCVWRVLLALPLCLYPCPWTLQSSSCTGHGFMHNCDKCIGVWGPGSEPMTWAVRR